MLLNLIFHYFNIIKKLLPPRQGLKGLDVYNLTLVTDDKEAISD